MFKIKDKLRLKSYSKCCDIEHNMNEKWYKRLSNKLPDKEYTILWMKEFELKNNKTIFVYKLKNGEGIWTDDFLELVKDDRQLELGF